MKRDWKIIRNILIALEEKPYEKLLTLKSFSNENPADISYNMELLISADLVQGKMSEEMTKDPQDFFASSLTWEGHDFLASIKDDATWIKTAKVIASKGGAITFELVKSIAVSFLTEALIPK